MCRSRRELSNEYLLAKIGVDTAENEPLEVWGKNSIQYSIVSLPSSRPPSHAGTRSAQLEMRCRSECIFAPNILPKISNSIQPRTSTTNFVSRAFTPYEYNVRILSSHTRKVEYFVVKYPRCSLLTSRLFCIRSAHQDFWVKFLDTSQKGRNTS